MLTLLVSYENGNQNWNIAKAKRCYIGLTTIWAELIICRVKYLLKYKVYNYLNIIKTMK